MLLSNPYSKSYFLSSLDRSEIAARADESTLSIDKVTDFINAVIQHIVTAQTKSDGFETFQ